MAIFRTSWPLSRTVPSAAICREWSISPPHTSQEHNDQAFPMRQVRFSSGNTFISSSSFMRSCDGCDGPDTWHVGDFWKTRHRQTEITRPFWGRRHPFRSSLKTVNTDILCTTRRRRSSDGHFPSFLRIFQEWRGADEALAAVAVFSYRFFNTIFFKYWRGWRKMSRFEELVKKGRDTPEPALVFPREVMYELVFVKSTTTDWSWRCRLAQREKSGPVSSKSHISWTRWPIFAKPRRIKILCLVTILVVVRLLALLVFFSTKSQFFGTSHRILVQKHSHEWRIVVGPA